MKTAVGYLRRSTDRQEQSIPDQRRAIERFAEERGYRILRFYTDDAISGTSAIGRQAFQSLVADAGRSTRQFGTILVYDVKRFGRVDNDEAGYYRHLLRQHGVEVLYVSENFSGDGTDDLLRPVKQWQAREESKDLSKVTIRGLLSKSETGTWMGGVPPYGYDLRYETMNGRFLMHVRYMADGTKQVYDEDWSLQRTLDRGDTIAVSRTDRCRLVLSDPARQATVREIFRLYVEEDRGFSAIADALNRRGVPSPRGPGWSRRYSGKWSITTVRAILLNPTYGGDLVWNRRTDARFHRIVDGQAVERPQVMMQRLEPNDESDWVIVRDAHEAIVSRRVFEAARAARENRESSRGQRGINQRTGERAGTPAPHDASSNGWTGPRSKYLLSGLMTCSLCGSRYEGHSQYRKAVGADGRRQRTLGYACGGYIRHGRHACEIGRYPKAALERRVVGAALEQYAPFAGDDAWERIHEAIREQVGVDLRQIAKLQKTTRGRLKQVDERIRTMLDNITTTNRDLVDTRIGELSLERDRLETRLESLAYMAMSEAETHDIIEETAGFIAGLEAALTEGPLDRRQATIRRCIEGIVVLREENALRINFRRLPVVGAGSIESSTRTVTVPIE